MWSIIVDSCSPRKHSFRCLLSKTSEVDPGRFLVVAFIEPKDQIGKLDATELLPGRVSIYLHFNNNSTTECQVMVGMVVSSLARQHESITFIILASCRNPSPQTGHWNLGINLNWTKGTCAIQFCRGLSATCTTNEQIVHKGVGYEHKRFQDIS
jgi:hypothetical protein